MNTEIGQAAERIRIGREVHPQVLIAQVGLPTVLAISGGRVGQITDTEGYPIGIVMPCGPNRELEITLNFLDLYTVRRYRRVVKGEQRGNDILEFEADDIYCTEISQCAWEASLWAK